MSTFRNNVIQTLSSLTARLQLGWDRRLHCFSFFKKQLHLINKSFLHTDGKLCKADVTIIIYDTYQEFPWQTLYAYKKYFNIVSHSHLLGPECRVNKNLKTITKIFKCWNNNKTNNTCSSETGILLYEGLSIQKISQKSVLLLRQFR